MKKVYLSPDVRDLDIRFEINFMISTTYSGSTGEDLDDPFDTDPWS